MTPPRVLVTGATGFIGGAVCRALARHGVAVHALTRHGGRPPSAAVPAAAWHSHDGSDAGLVAILRETRPDAIVHVAAFVPDSEPADVQRIVAGNILFGTQLLDAARATGCRDIINTGTYWEHLDGDQAVSLYAALKQAFARVLQFHCDAHGMRAVTLTLYDTYGPGDPRGKFVSLLVDAARTQTPLPASDGQQRIDLLHVDDVAQAYVVAWQRLATMSEGRHERYAVRSSEAVSLRELAEAVSDVLQCPVPVEWGARPRRPRTCAVPPALPILPGWSPQIRLADGVLALAHERAHA